MKKSNQSGSILLIVFFIMTIILICNKSILFQSYLSKKLFLKRCQLIKQQYITEGILQYAFFLCHNYQNFFLTNNFNKIIIDAGNWKLKNFSYTGKLILIQKKKNILAIAKTKNNQNKLKNKISCIIQYKKSHNNDSLYNLIIKNWRFKK